MAKTAIMGLLVPFCLVLDVLQLRGNTRTLSRNLIIILYFRPSVTKSQLRKIGFCFAFFEMFHTAFDFIFFTAVWYETSQLSVSVLHCNPALHWEIKFFGVNISRQEVLAWRDWLFVNFYANIWQTRWVASDFTLTSYRHQYFIKTFDSLRLNQLYLGTSFREHANNDLNSRRVNKQEKRKPSQLAENLMIQIASLSKEVPPCNHSILWRPVEQYSKHFYWLWC